MKKMDPLKIIFSGIFTLLISTSFFGQHKQDIDIYTNPDGTVIIYLLPDNKFGYTSYNGISPYTFKNRKNKGDKPGSAIYEVKKYGSGDYSLYNDKLRLNFIRSDHPVDSISKTFLNTSGSKDSLEIKMIIKPYYAAIYLESEPGIGTIVTSKDSTQLLNTGFENYGKFRIAKSQLPLGLLVNEDYELRIDKSSDQIIEIFINPFEKMATGNPEDKILDFNTLTEITPD